MKPCNGASVDSKRGCSELDLRDHEVAITEYTHQVTTTLIHNGSFSSHCWSHNTVCEWKGITCDTAGNINIVAVNNEGLEGTLPTTLGQLTTLTELYLSSNAFTGSIPLQLVGLPKIKTLDLSLNKLDGALPLPFSSSIETLHLGHNALSGRIVNSTFESAAFRTIQTLDLKYNKLEGTLPPSLSGLSSIRTLDLSNNKIHGTLFHTRRTCLPSCIALIHHLN